MGNIKIFSFLLKKKKKKKKKKTKKNCKKKHFKTSLICGDCNFLQDPSETIYKLTYFQLFEM